MFSPSWWHVVSFLVSIHKEEVFIFNEVHLINFFHGLCQWHLKTHLQTQYVPDFYSLAFYIYIYGSFWTGFCRWCKSIQIHSLHVNVCPSTICWKDSSFPIKLPLLLCQRSGDHICVCWFSGSLLWSVDLFIVPQYNTVLIIVAFTKAWSWVMSVLWLFFSFNIVLCILPSFASLYKLWVWFVNSHNIIG